MEVTNSSLKQQLKELQEKLETSQFREQSEICTLNKQLAACNDKLRQEAVAKEKLKEEIETFKGNFSYTVVQIQTYDTFSWRTSQQLPRAYSDASIMQEEKKI